MGRLGISQRKSHRAVTLASGCIDQKVQRRAERPITVIWTPGPARCQKCVLARGLVVHCHIVDWSHIQMHVGATGSRQGRLGDSTGSFLTDDITGWTISYLGREFKVEIPVLVDSPRDHTYARQVVVVGDAGNTPVIVPCRAVPGAR